MLDKVMTVCLAFAVCGQIFTDWFESLVVKKTLWIKVIQELRC